ncbi:acetyl-coenzyme a synthetase [Gigaspora margarita]|uniref:Acetyl-coenzyme A synthetase n=1 Tax=Gigaspora margarita TaxID=4874 RepID=A0A8H4EJY9_GIGMA|nr:acetyl-coenzyme a synthetase [Gigaspora margarita]
MSTDHLNIEFKLHPVPNRLLSRNPPPHVNSIEQYKKLYKESIKNPTEFWGKLANELLTWHTPFKTVLSGGFEYGDVTWFREGQLNASYNCLDRHAIINPDKVAIIYEADEPDEGRKITYRELLHDVCRFANVLKAHGVRKGDIVTIYMPMVPEAAIALLACARLGAVHSVVFAGFSSDSLRNRILDASSKFIITANEGRRGGKTIHIKKIIDEALTECPGVKRVFVFRRTDSSVPFSSPRDVWWHDEIEKQRPYRPPEIVNAEDPLFMIYTSGSTGKPKGVLHATGGYLLSVVANLKYVFDYHEDDIFGCMTDIGWAVGHNFIVYGPLTNGGTAILFESTPVYPTPSRYWEVVAKHKITQFFTAPTAIRLLRKFGREYVDSHDLSSLRVIISAGEPINPDVWEWYNEVVGRSVCSVIDNYWQTETGSIILAPFPGVTATKPGSVTFPFFGIDIAILDPETGEEIKTTEAEGILAIRQPWPSIARTIYNDHNRYLDTYLKPYKGYYFTSDGVGRDRDGYYWIRGRMDDVINVSGHRLSTSEIESALIMHPATAEAAAIGVDNELKGQCVHAFVNLKSDHNTEIEDLVLQVRESIGPFAAPEKVYIVNDLPKTRSGKIMRRVLKKIVDGQTDSIGDLSTLANPEIVDILIEKVKHS